MLRKQRTKEHVRGRPKDHTSNMQTEFRVSTGRRRSGKSHGIPCVGGKSPKPGKHEIPCDRGKSPKTRKYRTPCDTEFRVEANIRNSVFPRKNLETPNSRNPATCSKKSGTRPDLRTSESLDIRKDGENQRPMQNRILEQVSSAGRRTSRPTRRVRNEGSDADEAWSRKGSKPKTRRASS
jgi:hypothetical protein